VTLPGAAPVVLPTWLWTLLHGIALLSLFMLGALVVVGCADFARNASARRERAFAQPALLLVVVFTALAVVIPVVVAAASDAPIFDRYLLPLVPVTAALALRIGRSAGLLLEPARSVAGVATAALAAVGFMVVDATATVDGAKWQLATNVQSLGFAPATIDGGYEWFGLHQTGIVRPTTLVGEGSPLSNSFGDQTICVVVRHAAAGSRHEPPAADRAPGEPWRAGEIVARYRARSVTGVVYDLEAVATDAGCVPGAGDPT
jgi:hypothetical protein